jgi:ABC-type Mn2+/Zn2+ transport system ATPase subunit
LARTEWARRPRLPAARAPRSRLLPPGKTTLLTRIAAGDINNFPKDVSTYYIQHEILAEAGTSVTTFMHGEVPEGCSTERITEALTEVGFTAERAAAAVSELSGGWRMKLAIARSMLWNADLLLLDEPTKCVQSFL